MMAMDPKAMDDEAPAMRGQLGRIVLIVAGVLGVLFFSGIIAGIMAAHADKGGGPLSVKLIAILAVAVLLMLGSAFAAWRGIKAFRRVSGPQTTREKRYYTVMSISLSTGALIGVIMAIASLDGRNLSPFGNGPLPPLVAIALALVIGIGLPALSLYWHRSAIDEQEAAAYSKGALFAMYAFWIVAPVWWLLWRGGIVPAPDGVTLYMGTMVIAGAVWFWAKYR